MKRAIINPLQCKSCAPCNVEINCEKKAIIRENEVEKPWIDFYKCCGCMKCKSFCNNSAVLEISQPCDGKSRKGWWNPCLK